MNRSQRRAHKFAQIAADKERAAKIIAQNKLLQQLKAHPTS